MLHKGEGTVFVIWNIIQRVMAARTVVSIIIQIYTFEVLNPTNGKVFNQAGTHSKIFSSVLSHSTVLNIVFMTIEFTNK